MKKHLILIVSFVSVSILYSFCVAYAQPTLPLLEGKISGTVTDASTGLPIPNVALTVDIGSSINQTVMTNSTGQYFIGGLTGNLTGIVYNVTAVKAGYQPASANVTLRVLIDFLPPAIQNFTLVPTPTVTPTSLPIRPAIDLQAILVSPIIVFVLAVLELFRLLRLLF